MKAGQKYSTVLFDGVCNFCNASVNFIIRHDRKALFRFAPLQSDVGVEMQRRYGLDPDALDTLVLIDNERAHLKSSAALRIVRRLGGGYPVLYALIVVPPFVRDFFYDRFARNRYRWFGKTDERMVPTAELRNRFLSD